MQDESMWVVLVCTACKWRGIGVYIMVHQCMFEFVYDFPGELSPALENVGGSGAG